MDSGRRKILHCFLRDTLTGFYKWVLFLFVRYLTAFFLQNHLLPNIAVKYHDFHVP